MKEEKKQTPYSRQQDITILLPIQFLLLCKLCKVPPVKVFSDFMGNAGFESYGTGNEQKNKAMEYFISCKYGQDYYTEADIRQMFKELDAVATVWPGDVRMKFLDQHTRWRKKYYRYWFKKWFLKIRRRQ